MYIYFQKYHIYINIYYYRIKYYFFVSDTNHKENKRVDIFLANRLYFSVIEAYLNCIIDCVNGSRSRVRIGNRTSESFNANKELRQGDALSLLLFNIALEKEKSSANITMEMYTNTGPKLLLAFSDYIGMVEARLLASRNS